MIQKRFWRCFVCNDVHSGLKPPQICPTCNVKNAYVEISAREAKLLDGSIAETEFAREDFRKAIEKMTEGNEFMVNPNVEKVGLLLDGIMSNERNSGLKYCPCRLITLNFDEDAKLICPCNFIVHETYKGVPKGECWCGLFVKR